MVPTSALPRSPGHPLYMALNALLSEAEFDKYVEVLCEPLYRDGDGPSIPSGMCFRTLLVGYCEGIYSQRSSAWSCGDSLSPRNYSGQKKTVATPDHLSLTVIRMGRPKELIAQFLSFVLGSPREEGAERPGAQCPG